MNFDSKTIGVIGIGGQSSLLTQTQPRHLDSFAPAQSASGPSRLSRSLATARLWLKDESLEDSASAKSEGRMHRSLLRRANVGYGGPGAAYDRQKVIVIERG